METRCVSYWWPIGNDRRYCGRRREGLERHGKEQCRGVSETNECGVTSNRKSLSRRTFQQVVHTRNGHNFFALFWLRRSAELRRKNCAAEHRIFSDSTSGGGRLGKPVGGRRSVTISSQRLGNGDTREGALHDCHTVTGSGSNHFPCSLMSAMRRASASAWGILYCTQFLPT